MDMTLELRPDVWMDYFAAVADPGQARVVADGGRTRRVTVEVTGDRAGDRRPDPKPLHAIRYDPEACVLEVALGHDAATAFALRHFICDPRMITVGGRDPLDPSTIRVGDASGIETLIHFFRRGASAAGSESQTAERLVRPRNRRAGYVTVEGR
jgi:hypothetical protein